MDRPIVRLCHLTFFCFAVSCFSTNTGVCRAAEPYSQVKNIVYREAHGVGLLLDTFQPSESNANGLGIIQVVSGGWDSGRGKIRDLERAQTFRIFCGRGYTVFAIRPGSLSKFSGPEMVDNLEHGIVWVKQHAEQYKIDPTRLGLVGASAGGHLGSLVALKNDRTKNATTNPSVAAAGIFFPPSDFLDYDGITLDPRGNGRVERRLLRLMGHGNKGDVGALTDEQIETALKEISPAHQVSGEAPPFLIFHGDADPVVPIQQSYRMIEELRKSNVSCKLVVKPGGGHPWLTIHQEVSDLADWLDRQLYAAIVYVSVADENRISIFDLDREHGKLLFRDHVSLPSSPGSLAFDPLRKYLFAAYRSTGELASFAIDRNGALKALSTVAAGADPAFVATDATGQYLMTAYYVAGKVTVHRIQADGKIEHPPGFVKKYTAHNLFLQLMVNGGVVGLFFFLSWLVWVWRLPRIFLPAGHWLQGLTADTIFAFVMASLTQNSLYDMYVRTCLVLLTAALLSAIGLHRLENHPENSA